MPTNAGRPLRDRLHDWTYVVAGSAAIAVGTVVGIVLSIGDFIGSGAEPHGTPPPISHVDDDRFDD